uniref:Uncharacterized protein n=1 Tax=viral metagenome TaxID=1070528 RepID=A0A6C0E091_9ZZZZ
MYIFAIYSCKKYLEKANNIYDRINNKLTNTKVYIFYGNLNIEDKYKIIDDKFIELKVKDDYKNLSKKTLAIIRHIDENYSDIKGFFKCDDDIIVNIEHINKFISKLDTYEINYCGNIVNVLTPNTSTHKIKKMKTNKPIIIPATNYCGDPLYYLDKSVLCNFAQKEMVYYSPYEDVMIGATLQKNNIAPTNYKLYSDNIKDACSLSYHNSQHSDKLYVYIHEGFGNQLFQIACGLYYAQKYNKKFVINENLIRLNNHQKSKKEIIINLKKTFPKIKFSNKIINTKNYSIFKEKVNYKDWDTKISNDIYTYNNVILDGYFQHFNYLENNILEKYITIIPQDKKLLHFDFSNTCFIHIRLGDYVDNSLHSIELEKYYKYCIQKILSENNKTKFYICTNQYDKKLSNIIKNIGITNYVLQDKNNNYNDTLFIMKNCSGGICANSTLSYMGVYLQKEKNNIFMPYPPVNLINDFKNLDYSMYPKWANVYDTIKDEIVVL